MVIKWALTNKCNLKCKHCYNSNLRNENDFIDLNTAKQTIQDMSKNYVTNIQLLGGEPLMYPFITEIVNECTKNGITTWINTNGTNFNNENSKELINAGMETFIFSIDGPNEKINDSIRGQGSFCRSVKGLKYVLDLKGKDTKVTVNTVLNRDAVLCMDDMIEFISQFNNLDGFTIGLPDIVGNATNQNSDFWADYNLFFENVIEFAKKVSTLNNFTNISLGAPPLVKWYLDKNFNTKFYSKSKEYCMGGSFVYFIDADGIVYPCNLPSGINYFREQNKYEHLLENCNIKTKSFSEIYTRAEYLEFFKYARSRNLTSRDRFSNTICSECPFSKKSLCGISCPVENKPYEHAYMCEILIKKETRKIFDEVEKSLAL